MTDDAGSNTTEVESEDETPVVDAIASDILPAAIPAHNVHNVLLLFSGAQSNASNLEDCLRAIGLGVECYDRSLTSQTTPSGSHYMHEYVQHSFLPWWYHHPAAHSPGCGLYLEVLRRFVV